MSSDQFDPIDLQGTTYKIPKPDASPPWGEELNDYLKALGDAFATIVGPADIQETTANIANNQSSANNINGLSFDPSTVRAAFIDYAIYRSTNSVVKKESGSLNLLFDSSASMGNKWSFGKETIDDSDVVITVTDAGQAQYTSSNMAGTGYSGIIIFRARGILQS